MSVLKELTRRNDYAHIKVTNGGERHNVLRIVCSECDDTQDVKLRSRASTCDQEFADRMFRAKKWVLGKDRRHDRCPTCVQQEAQARKARQAELAAQEPEAPKFNKKSVIEFLEGVIEKNEIRGTASYINGWSDEKVAAAFREDFPRINTNDVFYIRREAFGKSRNRRTKSEIEQAKMKPDIVIEQAPRVLSLEQMTDQLGQIQDVIGRLFVLLSEINQKLDHVPAIKNGAVPFHYPPSRHKVV